MTNRIITDVAESAELVGRVSSTDCLSANPALRRSNRIRGSLAIEQNTMTLDQVTAVLDGKRGLAPPKDIAEVHNAFEIYERLDELNPYSIDDLLTAHGMIMQGLKQKAGVFRSRPVGVVNLLGEIVHFRTMSQYISDVVMNLLNWVQDSELPMLV